MSLVRRRSRATVLVALVAFGVVCHAQMPRRVASDVKSCDTQFANCQALMGAVRAEDANDVLRLVAIPLSSKSNGAPFACANMITDSLRRAGSNAPCRDECARRHEHERAGAAGRRRAVS
jgi:hypothetical protein